MTLSVGKTRKKRKQQKPAIKVRWLFGGNREKAIIRDGEKCVRCGMTREEHKNRWGRDITVDHINGRGKTTPAKLKDNRLENLQTLCYICHGVKDYRGRLGKKTRKILQIDLEGNVIATHRSAEEIGKSFGLNSGKAINACLNGRLKRSCGYVWKYEEIL